MKKSTWIMLGIFAVLLAAFLLYPKIAPSDEEPVEPTATPHILKSLDDQALKSILYESPEGETIQLDKVDTLSWTVATHPDGVVTAGNVEEIISYLSGLKILSEVTDDNTLSEVGLDNPQQSITFVYEDGSEYALAFGNLTVLGDGYYTLVNGQDIVVLPDGGIAQLGSLFDAIIHPPTPTPEFTETSTETSPETPAPSNTPTP
jgi:hypothetical protein